MSQQKKQISHITSIMQFIHVFDTVTWTPILSFQIEAFFAHLSHLQDL